MNWWLHALVTVNEVLFGTDQGLEPVVKVFVCDFCWSKAGQQIFFFQSPLWNSLVIAPIFHPLTRNQRKMSDLIAQQIPF